MSKLRLFLAMIRCGPNLPDETKPLREQTHPLMDWVQFYNSSKLMGSPEHSQKQNKDMPKSKEKRQSKLSPLHTSLHCPATVGNASKLKLCLVFKLPSYHQRSVLFKY